MIATIRLLLIVTRTNLLAITLMFSAELVLADMQEVRASYIQDSATNRHPVTTTFPTYPAIARRDRIEGQATVCFTLDKRGKARRLRIKSSTHKIFRKPALRAMKKSTFEPLLPGQLLEKIRTCRTYRFNLIPVVTEHTED